MKNFTDSGFFVIIVFILSVTLIAKIIWIVVSMLFLPNSGVEHQVVSRSKALYYHVKLANKLKEITPIKKTPNVVKSIGSMRGISLVGLYSGSKIVVTVQKAGKEKVLAKGDNIDGFVLDSGGSNYAIFKKDGKDFKLMLKGSNKKSRTSSTNRDNQKITSVKKPKKDKGISKSDYGSTVVERNLLNSYTKDIDKVWRDIGIGEYKQNNRLKGFKINFIKKGSDFEKLGLRKGDILKVVNGEELTSYNAAFSFYKNMDSVENLSLTIIRDNQEMELEYEIK
jgi:general secretion pathway protein C